MREPSLLSQLIALLTPFAGSEGERRALLIQALGLGHPLLPLLNYDGAAETFLTNLLNRLVEYGEVEAGKPAVIALLDAIYERVGVADKARIDALRPQVQALNALDRAYRQPILAAQPAAPAPIMTEPVTLMRRLDAAMPKEARLDAPTEVWAKICLPASVGLRGELPAEVAEGDVIEQSDARSATFPVTFPRDPVGRLISTRLCVQAVSDDFDVEVLGGGSMICAPDQIELELPPEADSATAIFQLTPRRGAVIGVRARVQIIVYDTGRAIGRISVNTLLVQRVSIPQWALATVGAGYGGMPTPPLTTAGVPAPAPSAYFPSSSGDQRGMTGQTFSSGSGFGDWSSRSRLTMRGWIVIGIGAVLLVIILLLIFNGR